MSDYLPRIGYASMNDDVFPQSYRTCRKDNISDEKLIELIEHNLNVLESTIDYNIRHQNKMFRVSSSLIPFGSSDLNTLDWENHFSSTFERIKDKIKNNDIRISMHPGQYTVLNSPSEEVVENAIKDLEYHTKVIRLLAPYDNSKIIIHVGGIYNDKDAAMERFVDVYNNRLASEIKRYLVIENDDRLYTVEDALNIHSHTSIPVVFDNLHHNINPSLSDLSISDIITRVVNTWKDVRPKFHYSQQHPTKRIGAHSDTINLNEFIKDYNEIYADHDVDIMLEVKDKNRSFIKINQYFNPSQKELQREWSKYKYVVMSKSTGDYNILKNLVKNNEINPIEFYEVIDRLTYVESNPKLEIKTLNHIWSYFKNVVTKKENETYLKLLNEKNIKKLKTHLKRIIFDYEIKPIIRSYYL